MADPIHDLGELEARLDPRRPDRAADVSESEVAALCVEVRQQRDALVEVRAALLALNETTEALRRSRDPVSLQLAEAQAPVITHALADLDAALAAAPGEPTGDEEA